MISLTQLFPPPRTMAWRLTVFRFYRIFITLTYSAGLTESLASFFPHHNILVQGYLFISHSIYFLRSQYSWLCSNATMPLPFMVFVMQLNIDIRMTHVSFTYFSKTGCCLTSETPQTVLALLRCLLRNPFATVILPCQGYYENTTACNLIFWPLSWTKRKSFLQFKFFCISFLCTFEFSLYVLHFGSSFLW